MLSDYTSLLGLCFRIARQTPFRLLWKFVRNFCWPNFWNMADFERRMARNEPFFPAFTMISVTEACNLACKGCWVTRGGRKSLTPEQLDGIITSSKKKGSSFFGILGGEPLLYKGLLDIMEKHSDCYFQLFTNGTCLSEDVAKRLRRMGHVTPLISLEGLETESDERRGKDQVFLRTMKGIENCRKQGLIFGIAASICKGNMMELASEEHVQRVTDLGAAYLWYYIYRPVGAEACPEIALDKEEILSLRRFMVEARRHAPVAIIDTYWDEEGKAMCPAATGMSHHVSPSGAVEFCPPLQMAREFLNEKGDNLVEIYQSSSFLSQLRQMTAETSRGCILLEDPAKLVAFLEEHEALETTSRATVLEEFRRMTPKAGHDMRDEAIPEKNPLYRMLKKRYFFGFGAYG